VNVVTGRVISSLIRATFSDESTPPDSSTPNGTSETIRLAMDCFRSRVSSTTASGSLRSFSDSSAEASGRQSHHCAAPASPRQSIVTRYPAGTLNTPRNIVSGAGATMNVK
jgi:hypothetical protein